MIEHTAEATGDIFDDADDGDAAADDDDDDDDDYVDDVVLHNTIILSEGDEEFLRNIRLDLVDLYPSSDDLVDSELSIKEHLSCATQVVQYIFEFIPG